MRRELGKGGDGGAGQKNDAMLAGGSAFVWRHVTIMITRSRDHAYPRVEPSRAALFALCIAQNLTVVASVRAPKLIHQRLPAPPKTVGQVVVRTTPDNSVAFQR